ncbi:bidirectional sugar transporter SWEET5-like [Pyrus ussuriensis x Pyrus communis]|uniref:Bidirectional sugar transporter SWEET n=1 Tax=Pyrus ussuriensis x Pyrus communis TaxID=2448454 RepID=A0A5N5I2K9_9ROSA|nr:bidirectional sugar transporter SWEET5-like [Pyrus x bretschneideri]KAB2633377.1 bidirectional sugar transporter SWEET5-like [Pyrus ussuriensis x Pyrus communis]
MVDTGLVRTVIGIIGNIISLIMFLSPIPTFYRIVKQKTVSDFKPDPYVVTLLNCALWVFYGMPFVHPDSILVVSINGAGVVIELVYILLFLIFSLGSQRLKIFKALVVEVIFFVIVVLVTMYIFHTTRHRSLVVGIICIIFNILMYLSPLTVMRMVIKTKSVKYMPFYLSLANFFNGVVWLVYSLLKFDANILIPNGLGTISGAVQLILYATFYRTTQWEDDDNDRPRSEVQVSNV